MYNTLDEYKKYKEYESMIFGELDYNKLSKLCNVSDVIFFRKTIIHMLMHHYISKNELSNINLILKYFEKNHISNSIINSILNLLNINFSDDLYFYRKEKFIRTRKLKYLNKLSDDEISNMKDEINNYILYDLFLLDKLNNESSGILNNNDFNKLIYSIRTYLHEYPEMFTNEDIYNKVMNLLNLEQDKKDTIKTKNKINRKIKMLNIGKCNV